MFVINAKQALELIRGYASAGCYEIEDHARLRMRQRNVLEGDLRSALSNAFRCSLQDNGRWRVDGPDLDGDDLTVIVVIEDGLIIITLY
jgi:hypothetical protein